jgi:hypothetical protein
MPVPEAAASTKPRELGNSLTSLMPVPEAAASESLQIKNEHYVCKNELYNNKKTNFRSTKNELYVSEKRTFDLRQKRTLCRVKTNFTFAKNEHLGERA